jgi:hypothetical protein
VDSIAAPKSPETRHGAPDRAATPRFQTAGLNWLTDFDWRWNGLYVRKTGAWVPFDHHIIAEVLAWFQFYLGVMALKPMGPAFSFACAPERLRPWYLLWPVLRLAGGKQISDPAKADLVVHFEDATESRNAPPQMRADARLLNFSCPDVSKTRVADAFEAAFGYALAIDPLRHEGAAVEKSEENGVHDGRVVHCPTEPLPGKVYQKLIDARGRDPNIVEDWRTPTVGGEGVCVYIKRRPISRRFTNDNSGCELMAIENAFSSEERAKIADFTRRLGLDWGGLDVLRDRGDGRLYIVDANKTDMGPPIALPQSDKLHSINLLARALRRYLERDSAGRAAA